ncbi:hypothetical protein V6N12_038607 [Hibiscus sabdariffa]|uniref:Uncharacterized protein n=1 Tax=Hibiscus sabdariffa TaxID=183260 RepID=A0ABR2AK70_9ROSI
MPEDEVPPPLVQRQTTLAPISETRQTHTTNTSDNRSKTQKERTRHRQRDKTAEVVFGTGGTDQKPVETKPVDYDNSKFDHYNMRVKYGSSDSFRF